MFTRRFRPTVARRTRNISPRARLLVQALERRDVPATFFVTTNSDSNVTGPAQDIGSLRQAIFDANANPGADIVSITYTGTINMAAGVFDYKVMGDTTIVGPGATLLTINGAGDSRIFNVSDDTTATINVSISGMTITGGAPNVITPSATVTASGGAILCRNEVLSLDSMVITGNKTPTIALDSTLVFYHGGAIEMSHPAVPGSSVGGGGVLRINNSQIEANTASTFAASDGGAIHFYFPGAGSMDNTFSMTNSTVSGNVSGKRGGGIYFTHYTSGTNGSFTMINSTVSSNIAQNEFAGGIIISGAQGIPMNIINSTITNNTATGSVGGGGIALNTGTGTLNVESSIIAENVGTTAAPDFYVNGNSIKAQASVFGQSTSGFASGSTGNTTVAFGGALLAPLASNGGLTKTHLLRAGSPAIDTGTVATTTMTTLSSAVSSGTIGFVTVNAPSVIAVGQKFQIDAEIMQVTAISGSTVTVTRAVDGSVTATHNSAAPLKQVVPILTSVGATSITTAATTIQVTSSVGLTPGMAMQIDSEIVYINAAVGSNTITVARGKNGTTPTTHLGATVIRAVPAFLGNLSVALGGTGADTIATVFSAQRLIPGNYFQIDSEILKVVSVSGSNVTVARAQNASVIAVHAVNAPLTLPYEQRGTSRIVTGGATPGFGPRIDAGAVEYNPAAVAAKVTSVSATTGADSTITVVFSTQSPATVDTTTLNNVFVTGPNGFSGVATPVGNSGTASSVTATYTITAPINGAAGWDYSDNGLYNVQVNPNTVADSTAALLNTTVIGQFKASITNTWTVDNAGDGDDSVYTAGNLTLREAVRLANESTGTLDSIAFDTASLGVSPTINFNTEIKISDSVSINTNNVAVTLDGGAVSRLFNIDGAGTVDVTLAGMKLQNALVGYPYSGGAIVMAGERLTITDCTFTNNSAFGGGGAIYASGFAGAATLNITRSSFSNNTGGAVVIGGAPTGLYAFDLTIVDSSFSNNTGAGLSAGGTGSMRIYGSTFEANTGNGISMLGTVNSNGFLIKNTTISGNQSNGISLNMTAGYGVTALIQNSTITRNTTTGVNGGGGILLASGTTSNLVDLESTIVAENSAEGFGKFGWDLASLGTSSVIQFKANYSVIGILDSTSKIAGIGNQTGTYLSRVNPMLQPIANNGGLTRTHMPYAGSPAQDYSSPLTTLSSTTTLNGGIDASQVTMTLTSAAAANVAIGNVIQIDAETMTVNAVSTNTITVNARGSGVVHATLATVSNNTAPVVNVSTIAGAITSGQTTIALTAGGVAAAGITTSAPNSAIQIDQEAMTVTGISGDTITVTRGVSPGSVPVAGSSIPGVAAAHSGGATVSRRIMVFPGTLAVGLSSPNPAGNYFKIDSEIMLALGNGSNGQNTFLRGQLGTSMAAHSLNSVVSYVPQANLQMVASVGGIDSITTTISPISASSFAVGSYIQIDSEMLLVTGVNFATNQVTVSRAQLSTTAAAHAIGTEIFQAFDQRGNTYVRTQGISVDAGAVEIDANIPYARTGNSTVSVGGGVSQTIVVTYTDNVAIDGTTIDTNNIAIVPPSGPVIYPTYVASSPDKGSTTSALTYSVSYTFTPPGGAWDFTDNGTYQIWTDASKQVTDTSATNVQTHQIGVLQVGIANSFIVTNNNDTGAGSLRDAINQSNVNAGVTDSITFDTTVFNIGSPQIISLSGELLITDQVLITGPGSSIVTVSGANSSRVFTIDTPTSGNVITLYGMTIANGNGYGTIDTFTGGGGVLIQDEAVTIDNCVITGNTVTTLSLNQGGGILLNAQGGSLTLKDSVLSNNFSTGNGGGLEVRYVNNIVNIQNTTISGNSTGASGAGAGLDFTQQAVGAVVNPSTITIDNSTFFNNAAGGSGGAMRLGQGNGTSRIAKYAITNSTFNNNVSFGVGGAISMGGAAEFTLLNSTISGNYALQGGGGIAGATASSLYTAVNMAIVNTVISGNTNKYFPDILFGGTTNGVTTTTINIPVVNSFIGAVDSATLKRLDNQGSTIGTNVNAPLDAKLAPLAFNGGSVKTMMPLPGSPLLNTGSNAPTVRMTTMTAANGTTGTTAIGASSITSSQTTIGVTSAAGITAGQTEITIDSESMFVTGVSGLTLTVIRATGTNSSGSGSSAASHAAGAVITFDTGARVMAPYWTYVGLPIQIDSEVMTVVQTNGNGAGTLSQAVGIGTGDTTFTVTNSGLPNPTIGFNGQLVLDPGTANAETVTITALSGSTVTVTRGGSPFAHAFGSTIANLSSPLLVNRAQANTTAAAHTAGTAVNRAAVRFLAFLGTGGMDGVSSPTTVFVSDSRWMFPGMTIQIDSETMTVSSVPSTTSVTVTRTAPVAHLSNAIISRPFLSTDARGSARLNGTIDIGAVEVDPTLPLATGTFADITTAGGTSYSFNVVYTDDVGLDTASFNSNNVKVTAPDGVTTIAVTYNPGDYTVGVGSATVKYSIPAFGGPTWQSSADGFYDISIKAGTAVTDTSANAVYPASLGSLHVAIVKNLIVTNTNDAGAGSLRQNILDANANVGVVDVITFDSTVFNTPQSITLLTGQMLINDPVTITGPGMANVFIDGNFQFRVFDIKLNPQYWTSTVTMTGMTIANGKATGVPAGAGIVDEAGVLVMDSITMTGHSASGTGGALQLSTYYSPLTISNSVFTANTAGNGGAGIYVGSNGSGVNSISGQSNYPTNMLVSITNSMFDSNIGSSNGVAVRVDSGAIATLNNDTMTNNFGIGSTGGAISANGSNLTVTNSVVTNNITSSVTGGTGNAGGFYFGGAATATISNTNISSNTAGTNPNPGQTAGSGGAAYVNGTASVTFSNDTINNNVSSSTATNNGGGAVFQVSTANTVTINNSVVMNNQAVNMGGAFFVSSTATLNINSSTVSNNSTTIPYSFASSTVQIMGGGALFTAGASLITINNSTMANNTSALNGGAIVGQGMTTSATNSGTLYINNSTLTGNTALSTEANSGGGGIFWSGAGGMLMVSNSTLSGNSAAGQGGAFLAGGNAITTTFNATNSMVFRNTTIANNTAALAGGGLNFNLTGGNTSVTLMSTIVTDNVSSTPLTGNDIRTGSASTKFNTFNTLVGDTTNFGPGTVAGALVAGPANLVALASNGGPTQTHRLNTGSTAIDAGLTGTGVTGTDLLTTVGATSVAFGATTIQVTSAAKIMVGTRLQIDSEIMTVSSVSTNTITVNRAQQGTLAANHLSGANVNVSSLLGANDQRGSGYLRVAGPSADIGAYEVQAPATVTSVVLSDGSGAAVTHRSQVRQIIVTFSTPVNFTGAVASAFTVHRTGNSLINGNPIGDVMLLATPSTGPATTVTITFNNADTTFVESGGTIDQPLGSLIDGLYDFTIDASKVSTVDGALDGDGIGGFGGNYAVVGSTGNGYYRFFGDSNGDGAVNQIDFNAFRLAFLGGPSNIFDFNGDGQVNQTDYNAFRLRFLSAP